MNNTKAHQRLVDELLFAFGSMADVRVWTRSVGYDQTRKIKYGIKGESDIQGVVAPEGRMLAIEVKTGKGQLTEDQERWRSMILKFGGIHIIARSVDQALADFQLIR